MKFSKSVYFDDIQYADWVKADSQFDYAPYGDYYWADYDEKKKLFADLPPFTLTSSKNWAKALMDCKELNWSKEQFWEWVYDGSDERYDDSEVMGIGFYGNKFMVIVYRLYTTSRNWDENRDTYGATKTQYGARWELLKYPIAKTKKDLNKWVKIHGEWLGQHDYYARSQREHKDKFEDWEQIQYSGTVGGVFQSVNLYDYIADTTMESEYLIDDTLKGLKSDIVNSVCRYVAYNPALFPLRYGLINHTHLLKGRTIK